jgi:CTP:molybdopterin cytidylyltransferase MocA
MSATVGVLAAGLGTRYDPTAESLKLLQPVLTGKRAGAPIVAAAARNLRSAVGDMPAIDPATITAVAGALRAGHVTVAPVYRGNVGIRLDSLQRA